MEINTNNLETLGEEFNLDDDNKVEESQSSSTLIADDFDLSLDSDDLSLDSDDLSLDNVEGTEEFSSLSLDDSDDSSKSADNFDIYNFLESSNDDEDAITSALGELDSADLEDLQGDLELAKLDTLGDESETADVEINPDAMEYILCDTSFNSFLKSSKKYTFSTQFLYYSLFNQQKYLRAQLAKITNFTSDHKSIDKNKDFTEQLSKSGNKALEVIVTIIYSQLRLLIKQKLQETGIVNSEYDILLGDNTEKYTEAACKLLREASEVLVKEDRVKVIIGTLREHLEKIEAFMFMKAFIPTALQLIIAEFNTKGINSRPLQYYRYDWCPNHPESSPNSLKNYLSWITEKESGLGDESPLRGKGSIETNHLTLIYLTKASEEIKSDFISYINHVLEGVEKSYNNSQELKMTNKSKNEVKLQQQLNAVNNKITLLNQDCVEEFFAIEIVTNYVSTIRDLTNDIDFSIKSDEMDTPMEDLGESWELFCNSDVMLTAFNRVLETQVTSSILGQKSEFVPNITEQDLIGTLDKLGKLSYKQLMRKHAVYPKKIELLENEDAQRVTCVCGETLRDPVHLFKFQFYVSSNVPKVSKDSTYYKDVTNPSMLFENSALLNNYRTITGTNSKNILNLPDAEQFGEKLANIPEPYQKFWTDYVICPHCGGRIQLPFSMMRYLAAFHANNITGLSGGARVTEYHRNCTLVYDTADVQAILPTFVEYSPTRLRSSYSDFVRNVLQNESDSRGGNSDSAKTAYVLGSFSEDSTPVKSKNKGLTNYAQNRKVSSNKFFSSYLSTVKNLMEVQENSLTLDAYSSDVLRHLSLLSNTSSSEFMQNAMSILSTSLLDVLKINNNEKSLEKNLTKFNKFVCYLNNGDCTSRPSIAKIFNCTRDDTDNSAFVNVLPRMFLVGLKALRDFQTFLIIYSEVIVLLEACCNPNIETDYLDYSPTSALRLREFFSKYLETLRESVVKFRLTSEWYIAQRCAILTDENTKITDNTISSRVNQKYSYTIAAVACELAAISEDKVFFLTVKGNSVPLGERIASMKSGILLDNAKERYNKIVNAYNSLYEVFEQQLTETVGLAKDGSFKPKPLAHSRGINYLTMSVQLNYCIKTIPLEGSQEDLKEVYQVIDEVNQVLATTNDNYKLTFSSGNDIKMRPLSENYLGYLFVYKYIYETIYAEPLKTNPNVSSLQEYTDDEVNALPPIVKTFLNSYGMYLTLYLNSDNHMLQHYCHTIEQYLKHDRFKKITELRELNFNNKVLSICANLGIDFAANVKTVLKALLTSLIKMTSIKELTPKNKIWECISGEFLNNFDLPKDLIMLEDVRVPKPISVVAYNLNNNYSEVVNNAMSMPNELARQGFLDACISDEEIDTKTLLREADEFTRKIEAVSGLELL